MRIRRSLSYLLAVVAIAAALTLAVQLRKQAPPEPARLLPAADVFLYANLGWARKVSEKPWPPVFHDPEYEKFIAETGFDFERDLDAVACAVHYPASWPGGGTVQAAEPRFSEVLVGKFQSERLAAYLKRVALSVENYNSVDIYTARVENRAFRVAILSVDSVAASNHDDPAVIRGIVDRSRRLASPFGGPAFLRRYYKRVQFASPVWAVARIEPQSPAFGGWWRMFSKPADLVFSASYNPLHLPLRTAVLHLRAEASTDNEDEARSVTEKLQVALSMFHGAEAAVGTPGTDADVKVFFDSLQVHQEDKRAVISAVVPTSVFHKLVEAPAAAVAH